MNSNRFSFWNNLCICSFIPLTTMRPISTGDRVVMGVAYLKVQSFFCYLSNLIAPFMILQTTSAFYLWLIIPFWIFYKSAHLMLFRFILCSYQNPLLDFSTLSTKFIQYTGFIVNINIAENLTWIISIIINERLIWFSCIWSSRKTQCSIKIYRNNLFFIHTFKHLLPQYFLIPPQCKALFFH